MRQLSGAAAVCRVRRSAWFGRPCLGACSINPFGHRRRLVPLKALEQPLGLLLYQEHGAVYSFEELLSHGMVKKVDQTAVVMTDVQQAARLLMEAQLCPCQ